MTDEKKLFAEKFFPFRIIEPVRSSSRLKKHRRFFWKAYHLQANVLTKPKEYPTLVLFCNRQLEGIIFLRTEKNEVYNNQLLEISEPYPEELAASYYYS